ncbi:MAG: hypothetical protein MN733_42825 [Nitrososphaera sp.]|nr:hypothetical protein [Nitrososphaera sp.]
MAESSSYTDDLRLVKSLLIVTSLQKRHDLKALQFLRELSQEIPWEPLSNLMIDLPSHAPLNLNGARQSF